MGGGKVKQKYWFASWAGKMLNLLTKGTILPQNILPCAVKIYFLPHLLSAREQIRKIDHWSLMISEVGLCWEWYRVEASWQFDQHQPLITNAASRQLRVFIILSYHHRCPCLITITIIITIITVILSSLSPPPSPDIVWYHMMDMTAGRSTHHHYITVSSSSSIHHHIIISDDSSA